MTAGLPEVSIMYRDSLGFAGRVFYMVLKSAASEMIMVFLGLAHNEQEMYSNEVNRKR